MMRSMIFLTWASLSSILIAHVNGVAGSQFKCMRPFAALSSFNSKSMRASENCNFGYFVVDNCTAAIACDRDIDRTCRIQVNFSGTLTSASEKKKHPILSHIDNANEMFARDDARYTLHLSLGGKTINYNGFNGRGYSSCCSLEGMGHCEWEGDSLMVRECDLFRRLDDDSWDSSSEDAPVVKGSVSKPLHTLVPGNGSVQLEFYHDTVALGKLRIPFEVLAEDLNPEQFAAPLVAQDILESNESTAAAAVALVAVPDDNKEHMERYVNKKIKKKRTEDENMAREEL